MVKKTLLSLAVATALVSITGCNVSTTDRHENKIVNEGVEYGPSSSVYPIFAPEVQQLPLAIDFLFAEAAKSDGTASVAVDEDTFPVTTAINKLAGFSTTAPLYIAMSEPLNPDTVNADQSVFLIALKNAEEDPTIDALDIKSIVYEQDPDSDFWPSAEDCEDEEAAANIKALCASEAYGLLLGADGQPVKKNPFSATQLSASDYEARYIEMGSDKTPAIQILFTKALQPKTKYIVVVTDEVKGASGETIGQSTTYQHAIGNDKIVNDDLLPVRGALQSWKELADVFLVNAGVKGKNVFNYAFTTDASLDDLKQYAAPGLFVKNNLTVARAEAMTDAEAAPLKDIVARKMAVARVGGNPNDPMQLADVDETTIAAVKANDAYEPQLFNAIANTPLAAGVPALSAAAVAPTPRAVKLVNPAAVDDQLAPIPAALGASPYVLLTLASGGVPGTPDVDDDISTRYIQGSIQLPDFLGAVAETEIAEVLKGQDEAEKAVVTALRADPIWKASTTVGGLLSQALGTSLPPKDVEVIDGKPVKSDQTNVTYRYPFPQPIGINTAPFLLTLPDTAAPACAGATSFKTVIFVHGITSNRTASAIYGAGLAKACIATVAIDLPLHGVAPADGLMTMLSMSTADAAATSSPWAGVGAATGVTASERHNNVWQNDDSMRVEMNYGVIAEAAAIADEDEKAEKYASGGNSGSAFINLQNFGRTHDNLRQAVVDLLNLNASLININAELTAAGKGTLDLNKVFVAGHSLGGIVASAFVAANNDPDVQDFVGYNPNGGGSGVATGALPKIQGLIVANSGGHLTKLLENSPAFAPTIVSGLAANGTMQGSENYEKFLSVFQATIDGVDPANTFSQLGDIPVQLFTVDGGLAAGNVRALPDTTVPVFDYFADTDTNPFGFLVNPTCFETLLTQGKKGLSEKVECASPVLVLPNAGVPTAKSDLAGTQGIKAVAGSGLKETTYSIANHSTFADAGSSMPKSTQEEGLAAQEANANFGDMVAKSIKLINGDGATAEAK